MTKANRSDYFKEYYQQNKEKKRKYLKEYHQQNKEKTREYYQQNKEKLAKWRKEYRKTPNGRASNLLSNYKRADRKYNRGEGNLTVDWIIENIFNAGKCHYCGREFEWNELGCDRQNSSLPHTKENCVPCCFECNARKHTTDYQTFKRIMPHC